MSFSSIRNLRTQLANDDAVEGPEIVNQLMKLHDMILVSMIEVRAWFAPL